LSMLPAGEREKWLKSYGTLKAYTDRTLTTHEALHADMQAGIARGWQRSVGENVEDVMSISLGFRAFEQPFAIVVAGPLARMLKHEDAIGQQFAEVKALLRDALPSANLTFLERTQ